MQKRLGLMMLATAMVMIMGGRVASAGGGGTYPPTPSTASVSVNKPVVSVGDSLTVSAYGLCLTSPVVFELAGSSTVGLLLSPPVTVAPDGTASYTFTVPGPASPNYVAWAKQASCSITLSTPVTVTDPAPTGPVTPVAPAPAAPTVAAAPATPTSPISVTASGLCPAETATFTLAKGSSTIATQSVMAASDGSASVTFPAQAAGDYTVSVSQACGTSKTAPVKVESAGPTPAPATPTPVAATPMPDAASPTPDAGAAPAGPKPLPTTGSESINVVQVALIAVAMGCGLVLVTRQRRLMTSATADGQ